MRVNHIRLLVLQSSFFSIILFLNTKNYIFVRHETLSSKSYKNNTVNHVQQLYRVTVFGSLELLVSNSFPYFPIIEAYACFNCSVQMISISVYFSDRVAIAVINGNFACFLISWENQFITKLHKIMKFIQIIIGMRVSNTPDYFCGVMCHTVIYCSHIYRVLI